MRIKIISFLFIALVLTIKPMDLARYQENPENKISMLKLIMQPLFTSLYIPTIIRLLFNSNSLRTMISDSVTQWRYHALEKNPVRRV